MGPGDLCWACDFGVSFTLLSQTRMGIKSGQDTSNLSSNPGFSRSAL